MKNALQEYFYYTRMERNGLIVLSILCLICYVLPYFILPLLPHQELDFSEFQTEIDAFKPTLEEKKTSSYTAFSKNKKKSSEIASAPISMFEFDPNIVTKDIFMKLGLSERVAQNIINYREKIGGFKKTEDLKKIYTLKATDYERLKDYVRIASLPQQAVKFEKKKTYTPPTLKPFPFDPNTITAKDLAEIGLKDKTIQTLINFRTKGGTFRKPADLQKIYGLSATVFEQLKPYIELPTTNISPEPSYAQQERSVPTEYSAPINLTIDINQATAEEWQNLRGIGPYFSEKIVGFRKKLGGFSNIEQVGQTYNFPDSIFQKIKPSLILSPVLKKIAINIANEKTLAQHPYISYQLAKAIVNYRAQHGTFQSLEDFKKMRILKKKNIEQLSPYLEF